MYTWQHLKVTMCKNSIRCPIRVKSLFDNFSLKHYANTWHILTWISLWKFGDLQNTAQSMQRLSSNAIAAW